MDTDVEKSKNVALNMSTIMMNGNFNDYYDLYFSLKDKSAKEFISIVDDAIKYSNYCIKKKNLLGMLMNYERFLPDAELRNYDISPKEIAEFMNKTVKAAYQSRNNTTE
jgi:hypothetical protein